MVKHSVGTRLPGYQYLLFIPHVKRMRSSLDHFLKNASGLAAAFGFSILCLPVPRDLLQARLQTLLELNFDFDPFPRGIKLALLEEPEGLSIYCIPSVKDACAKRFVGNR
eukprot:4928432-Pleurochrysis_carterae.AAC.2